MPVRAGGLLGQESWAGGNLELAQHLPSSAETFP